MHHVLFEQKKGTATHVEIEDRDEDKQSHFVKLPLNPVIYNLLISSNPKYMLE